MNIPRGATGFFETHTEAFPQTDEKQFRQFGYAVARRSGGTVREETKPNRLSNFYEIHMDAEDESVFILLNMHVPLVAFTSAAEPGNIAFIQPPVLPESASIYEVLSLDQLAAPVTSQLLQQSRLSRAEFEQIRYWKPETVGDVIFNYWD